MQLVITYGRATWNELDKAAVRLTHMPRFGTRELTCHCTACHDCLVAQDEMHEVLLGSEVWALREGPYLRGMIYFTCKVEGYECQFHAAVFDGKLFRCREAMENILGLYRGWRVVLALPGFVRELRPFIEKKLGFKYEQTLSNVIFWRQQIYNAEIFVRR